MTYLLTGTLFIDNDGIHDAACVVQPDFRGVVGNGAAVGEDEALAIGLGDGGANLVGEGVFGSRRQGAAFGQTGHQGLVGHGERLG